MTVADLDTAIAELRAVGTEQRESRAVLRELHQALMRARPLATQPPMSSLAAAREVVGEHAAEVVDAMLPRPRTVLRLLRAGALEAAWEVLSDNATGVVDEPFHAATATGASRTAWRLPLLTRIEPPTVFLDFPGFRDPRFGAPDECYDITDIVVLRQHLDEIIVDGDALTFGGWAALESLLTGPQEQVRVIATSADLEIAVTGRRLRRPDLVTGTAEALVLRGWAGWAATLDLSAPQLAAGTWAMSLEVTHAGIVRRSPLGNPAGELAQAATRRPIQIGSRVIRWDTRGRQWHLVVS
jgi:hypothetical protein